MAEKSKELALVEALENAQRRGLAREFADFEAFAHEVLELINQPDTPVNRATLGVGNSPGAITPLMAGGREWSYVLTMIPPTEYHAAGEQFMVEREEHRIFVVVVPEDVERRGAAAASERVAADLLRLAQATALLRLYRESEGDAAPSEEAIAEWRQRHPEPIEPTEADYQVVARAHPDLVALAGRSNPFLSGQN